MAKQDPIAPGARLRALRATFGYSYRDVARASNGGVNYSTIRNLEQQHADDWSSVTLGTLTAIARAFAMDVQGFLAFINGTGERAPPSHAARESIARAELLKAHDAITTALRALEPD